MGGTWYRTTAEVPLMTMMYLGLVEPRPMLFLNSGLAIAAGQDIPLTHIETVPYGEGEIGLMPILLHGHEKPFYILAEYADESSPLCRMKKIESDRPIVVGVPLTR